MTKVKESIRTPRPARTRKPSKGQQVGYVRVSSLDQNEVRQLKGLALNRTFTDNATGKDVKRPQLEAMQSFVREGEDAEYFGGLREQVLERDRYACRVCGDPGVHHREPGKSLLHLMIALCAGCHAKVHPAKVVLTEFPPLLLVLWREQHPEGHEQKYIDFDVRKPPTQSVPLNFEPARKD